MLFRHLASSLDPFVDQLLVLVGAVLGQAFGVDPSAVHALRAEMMLGRERRRIVERGDGQVHPVGVLLENESERRSAARAERPARDRRAVIPVGLTVPGYA